MKKIFVPLMTVAVVVALLIGGCMPAAPPVTPPPVTPPPVVEPPVEPVTPPVVEEERLVFAYVCAGDLTIAFLAEVTRGWTEACDLFGVDTTIGLAEYDAARVISLVDAAVAADVDGIFTFSWFDETGLTPPFQRAIDKGIQVVHMTIDNPAFTSAEVPFIGMDYVVQGHTLGTYWAERLTAEGRVTDVHIATFQEEIASPLHIDRRQGFLNGLADGGIEYIAPDATPVGYDTVGAMDIIKVYLIAHPETDVIWGSGAPATAACPMALEALGLAPGEVWFAGFDLEPETVAAIRAGYGAVNVDEVFSYGFLAATALYMRAKYGLVVGDLPITTIMVDQTNIDEFAP
ncbi:hypothetical protein ES703_80918 [subsurface metagenome]